MFTPTPFDPGLLVSVLAIVVLLSLSKFIGQGLLPATRHEADWTVRLSLQIIPGLMFLAGVASVICLHYLSYLVLTPAALLLFYIWQRKTSPSHAASLDRTVGRVPWVALMVVVAGCVAFEWWQTGWVMPDGSIRIIHYDYGYWALLIKGVLESRCMDSWSATVGAHVLEGPTSGDTWYHWNPLMLAGGISSLTGMMPLASLMHVVATSMNISLVLVSAAIVRHLTGMKEGKCLWIGGASLITVQIIVDLAITWLGLNRESDSMQHIRYSLACFFAYKFDGMILLVTILAWLKQQRVMAAMFLACAALSSPHAVATCGVTAGVLAGVGIILRRKEMWQTGLVIIAVMISTWAALHWVFGATLPTLHSDAMQDNATSQIFAHLFQGFKDGCAGLVLGAISIPGLLYLAFARDERFNAETRLLGWMGLCAILGSYMGYRLLTGVADNWHVVVMTHAVLVMPAGVWGLACIASSKWALPARITAVLLILLGAYMGSFDALAQYREYNQTPWKKGELDPVKKLLSGGGFGYFAPTDRQWWLPWHSSLAAALDVHCMRLQEIPTGNAERNLASNRPYQLVNPLPNEKPDDWSIRFANKIGIRYAFDFTNNKIPDSIKQRSRKVLTVPYFSVYELPTAP